MADVFLLTKAPKAPRSELFLKLIEHSEDAKLYLAGDGIYHLLDISNLLLFAKEVVACREDIMARGLILQDNIVIPVDFYGQFVKDMMENSEHIYVF